MLPSFAATATATAIPSREPVPFVGRERAQSPGGDPAQIAGLGSAPSPDRHPGPDRGTRTVPALGGSPDSGNDTDLDQTANGKCPLVCSCLWCEVASGVKLPLV
jgi:hypothetical protein